MTDFLIVITVDVPYPKEFAYRETASGVAPAVSRALKQARKDMGRKQIQEYRIKALKMA